MAPVMQTVFTLALAALGCSAEYISDILTSSVDESRALEIKAEDFWQPVLEAAEEMKMGEHLQLYADTEKVIAALPSENTYAREALSDALLRLRRADDAVLAQATQSSEIASKKLAAPAGSDGGSFFGGSFFNGGSQMSFLSQALRRFVDGGKYSEQLVDHVGKRQADILPLLRGAAASTTNVLGDCRTASKRSFDLLKYDIYNKGVPKTPEEAKKVAYRLVDAVGETRHRFMGFVTKAVTSIARDAEGKKDQAASFTMARAALQADSDSYSISAQVGAGSQGAREMEQVLNL